MGSSAGCPARCCANSPAAPRSRTASARYAGERGDRQKSSSATTLQPEDDTIVEACRAHGWRWFRGAEHDVLDRYYRAAVDAGATAPDAAIVRITADCPLTDPAVITALCDRFRGARADYASTSYPAPTFPLGISAEVMTFAALATAWREDQRPGVARARHPVPRTATPAGSRSNTASPAAAPTRTTAGPWIRRRTRS